MKNSSSPVLITTFGLMIAVFLSHLVADKQALEFNLLHVSLWGMLLIAYTAWQWTLTAALVSAYRLVRNR